ncbi:MAG: cyclic nucleotide-binding domain-containing protein, partial [Thermoplasmata archaeon]|nr:cyclic nucleotide-binding domain-containing protein [Thermoplasmata archaeon]
MSDPSGAARTQSLLGAVPLFSNLSKGQLRGLAESAQEKSFAAGATIVKQGEKGIGFYLILEGHAQVERSGKPVATLNGGQFFGEMAL